METEQSFTQAITQATIEAATAAVLAVREINPHSNHGQACTKWEQNRWPGTKTAHLQLESSKQMPGTAKLQNLGKKIFRTHGYNTHDHEKYTSY